MRALPASLGLGLAAVIVAVVFLWPGPPTGPEPLQYGRDTCTRCRMDIGRPGFGGEMRDGEGNLTKYDDVGCLLQALATTHREFPGVWVEDHDDGALVPLLGAVLVRGADVATPMGHGIVAFKDAPAADAFTAAHGGARIALEDLLHGPIGLADAKGTR